MKKTFAVIVQGSIFFTEKETAEEAIALGETYWVGDKDKAVVIAHEVDSIKHTQNSITAFKNLDGSEFYN